MESQFEEQIKLVKKQSLSGLKLFLPESIVTEKTVQYVK